MGGPEWRILELAGLQRDLTLNPALCWVEGGDMAVIGVAIGENRLDLNGGTIRDAAGNDADLSYWRVAST